MGNGCESQRNGPGRETAERYFLGHGDVWSTASLGAIRSSIRGFRPRRTFGADDRSGRGGVIVRGVGPVVLGALAGRDASLVVAERLGVAAPVDRDFITVKARESQCASPGGGRRGGGGALIY